MKYKMDGPRALHLIPKLFIIITVISLNNEVVRNGLMVSAQMVFRPLWDVSANVTNPCFVNKVSDDEVHFTGSPDHSCTLQVNASEGSHAYIKIDGLTNDSSRKSFFYVERGGKLDNCFQYRQPNKIIA